MAEIKIPIKIDGFKCVEDMAQAVLNYTYKEKTLKEWADSISEPKTNADRIRSMTDEELAEWLDRLITHCNEGPCFNCFMQEACLTSVLEWLKKEVEI